MKYCCLLLLFILFSGMPATAAAEAGDNKVIVNGNAVLFERPPIMEEGRILVPLRDIFSAMGAVVTWDDASNSASAISGEVRVRIPIGSYLPTVNAVPVAIDVPAFFREDRIFIPLRFAAEALGARLVWDAAVGAVNVVRITTGEGKTGSESDPQWGNQEKIDINSANKTKLMEIEGICETLATKLIAAREEQGDFKSFSEIGNLPAVTDSFFERMREKISIVYRKEGIACWYGIKFHGRRTASGEIYNKNLHTAAHRTLPFGTKVKVTFLRTGRSVWVRINDRGPHVAGRVIDLSHSAADAIGLTPFGIGRVELKIFKTWEAIN